MCRFHAGDSLEAIQENKVSVFVGQPWMFSLMANYPGVERFDTSNCRYFVSTGSKLAPELAARTVEVFKTPLYEAYGTTETGGIVAVNAFPGLTDSGSVGQPLRGMEISVFRADGQIASPKETGEIAVRGPAVMKGYRHRTDRSRSDRNDGWVFTGDEGFLDEDSQLTITGHSGDVIVKGGFAVHPREIEEVIEGLPHVAKVAVVSYPDPVLGDEIKACIVLKDGASIGPTEIMEYVKERIALYKCPKLIRFYRELPATPDGRIKRAELRKEGSKAAES
jgi:long-chain acyl-CoA synthetase